MEKKRRNLKWTLLLAAEGLALLLLLWGCLALFLPKGEPLLKDGQAAARLEITNLFTGEEAEIIDPAAVHNVAEDLEDLRVEPSDALGGEVWFELRLLNGQGELLQELSVVSGTRVFLGETALKSVAGTLDTAYLETLAGEFGVLRPAEVEPGDVYRITILDGELNTVTDLEEADAIAEALEHLKGLEYLRAGPESQELAKMYWLDIQIACRDGVGVRQFLLEGDGKLRKDGWFYEPKGKAPLETVEYFSGLTQSLGRSWEEQGP